MGLGLQIMPAPVGQGYSLRSTQDILAEKGSKHRMNGVAEKRKSGAEKRKKGGAGREIVLWGHCNYCLLIGGAVGIQSGPL